MASKRSGFADWLRTRSDGELAALFAERPDLLRPVPGDFGRLAGAASAQVSLQLAVDQLDTLALSVLRALGQGGPMSYADLAESMGAPPADEAFRWTVDTLRRRALVFGGDDRLAVPGLLHRIPLLPYEYGPRVSVALTELPPDRLRSMLKDLGMDSVPWHEALVSIESRYADDDTVPGLLAQLGPTAREALDRVARAGGRGRVENARREVTIDTASSPVEELLARAVLVPQGDDSVAIPVEVGLALAPRYEPPPVLETRELDAALVERTAGMHAYATVQAVEDLLDAWADTPPAQLRTGGLGVRDLRAAARTLDRTEPEAALVVELAYAAGLLNSGYADAHWLPTPEFDAWRVRPVASRWAALATGWLDSPRASGLVGGKDDRNKTINALSADVTLRAAGTVRRGTLTALADLPPSSAPAAGSLVEQLGWARPRGGRWRRRLTEWTLREAEQLGITGQGALTVPGRSVLAGDPDAAVARLEPELPALGAEVLLQPDMTAVAPGPLQPDVRRELAILAEVESTGGATVYRCTPASVRRALDAGRTGADIEAWLAAHSRTDVPQPLSYLIGDVARRHGRLRVGGARSYLRSDDEATLSEILASKRADGLAVRRIAPTVLVSRLDPEALVDGLRDLGYAPVAETTTGDVVVTSRRAARTQGRPRPRVEVTGGELPSARLIDQAVRVLRAGDRMANGQDRGHRATADSLPRNPASETLSAVHQAIAAENALWIGYANAEGRASLRLIEPVAVIGGLVEAYDHLRESRRTFALHRITGFATVDDDA